MGGRRAQLGFTLLLVGLNLVALNVLLGGWTGARVDLTEEGVFSISPATKRILRSLEEEVTIYGYFSERTHVKLAPLVPELVDLLEEYRAVSGGKVHVEILDPGDDDAIAQEAADRYGVQSTPFRLESKYETGIVNAYFALVVRYGDRYERYGFGDLIEVDPLPDGDVDVRLRNPEYDLTRAIKKVVYGFRGAHELFARLEGGATLHAFVSESALPDVFAEVPAALREAAAQLEEASGGKFSYVEANPAEDPEAQQQLRRWGLPPLSLGLFGDGGEFWLYAVLESPGDRLEQIVLTGESVSAAAIREAIENALRRATPGFLTTVGLSLPEPLQLPPQLQMQMGRPPREYEELRAALEEEYETRDVDLAGGAPVPSDVDVLLVVKPEGLSDEAVWQLDQYLMRGGRVVLLNGKYSANLGAQGLTVAPVDSGLDDWLAHHGLRVEETLVLDDRNRPLPIPELRNTALGVVRTWTMEPYPYLVEVRDDGFPNANVTASLDAVGIYWGSPIVVEEPDGDAAEADDDGTPPPPEVLPLLRSSERSWTDDDTARAATIGYEVPEEGLGPRTLGVALSGSFESAFAGSGPPPGVEDAFALRRSPETRLVLIGDADFVNDFVARSLQQTEGGFFVENLRFVQNLIDWTTLDRDLATIRGRGLVSRRLERLEPSAEAWIEAVNYAVPVALLALLGAWIAHRRRAGAAS